MSKYKIIDINTWNRRANYLWFKTFSNPCYGLNIKVDVTNIVEYSKKTNTSFFINFLYVVSLSFNEIEELRLRVVDDKVVLYDSIDPSITVMTKIGVYDNLIIQFNKNYNDFYINAKKEIERVKNQDFVNDGYNNDSGYNQLYITCLPWLSYESMVHPIPDNNVSSNSVPRICWGKYELENNKYILSFNLTVSHALVDGVFTAKALNLLKENALSFQNDLK